MQKSLNSLDFQQHKGSGHNSSSVDRPSSSLRSRDKLPEIGNSNKLATFSQRVRINVMGPMNKIDRNTYMDIYHVSIYCAHIQAHMQATEHLTQPDGSYMRRQKDINENQRSILVDWLINVCSKFKLLPETLFITVNLIDRYFSKFQIKKEDMQLVGVAALLIATKYEEIYPPTVKDFIYMTDMAFSRDMLLKMETSMLYNLDFDICQTSPYRFLERYSKVARVDSVTFFLAQYLLELALLDSKMNQYKPSLQASAALYLAMRVNLQRDLRRDRKSANTVWTRSLQEQTKYTSTDLQN